MEIKKYPKQAMVTVSTSTVVYCAKCKQPSGIYEPMLKLVSADVYYHSDCVSDETDKTETKVVELQLTDDLNVKSEGR